MHLRNRGAKGVAINKLPIKKASELFEMQQLDLAFNEAEFTADETVSEPTVENLPKKKKENYPHILNLGQI